MTLARRVFAGFLAIVIVLVLVSVGLADRRLDASLSQESISTLTREARLVASQWRPGVSTDSLANAAGELLHRRVTLIDSAGHVEGDSEFDPPELYRLQNHSTRPEVMAARASDSGWSRRRSPSAGDEELYVAVRAPRGIARISMTTSALSDVIGGAERDVLIGGAIAFLLALVLTWLYARGVSRPVVELRNVARAISSGDLSSRPRRGATGELGELEGAIDAMADQLQARLGALEADDAFMTATLASLDEGVIAVDAAGRVVRVNPAARELLGLRAEPPFPASELPRDHAIRETLDAAMHGASKPPMETSVGSRTLSVTGRPLASGSASSGGGGAVIAVLDVTPFRRLEAVRRDFVANVSHELRTPLTALTGSAEILAHDEVLTTEDRERFSTVVLNNARRMQRLVDDLLDLSRIESGGWIPRPQAVDVAGVAREVIAAAHPEARSKSVGLECRVHPDARTLYADPTALQQVLVNLVNNAVRYTSSGGVVSIVTEPAPGGATISVRDTGVGIAAEHLPRIFERFYRADPSRTREAGGAGLGLAVVKHLVEAHGGRVRADSTPNRGTTVSAFFPAAPAAA